MTLPWLSLASGPPFSNPEHAASYPARSVLRISIDLLPHVGWNVAIAPLPPGAIRPDPLETLKALISCRSLAQFPVTFMNSSSKG
jgi:hypothetical protein